MTAEYVSFSCQTVFSWSGSGCVRAEEVNRRKPVEVVNAEEVADGDDGAGGEACPGLVEVIPRSSCS